MIKVKNLTKIFNKGSVNENLALDRVTIDVKKGDFITVIGSNAAGKSTLMLGQLQQLRQQLGRRGREQRFRQQWQHRLDGQLGQFRQLG